MSGSATLEEASRHDDHRPRDKNSDYVCGKCIQVFPLALPLRLLYEKMARLNLLIVYNCFSFTSLIAT